MVVFAIGAGNARTKYSQKKLLEKYNDHPLLKREDEIAIKLEAKEELENIRFVLYACFRFERPNHGLPPQYRSELCDIGNEVTVRAAADKLQRHIDSLLLKYKEFERPDTNKNMNLLNNSTLENHIRSKILILLILIE